MTENKTIIVTGLTRIWAGITNIAKGLLDKNIKYIYFYQEHQEFYTQEDANTYEVRYAPHKRIKNIIEFFRLMRKQRPVHIEVYHHLPDPWLIIWQIIIARILNIPIITICTGGEILYWKDHTKAKKISVRLAFLFSKVVILKELYMQEYILKYGIGNLNKCEIIYNSIPIMQEPKYLKEEPNILFLNTFKPWRNIELIINAAEIVLKKKLHANFILVGLAGKKPENHIQKLVSEKKLTNHIRLLPFTKDPQKYYDTASIFLLPADVVFCNNALLEAMERGVPPIVSDVKGSELIVEHRVSGLIVQRNAEELAEAIILLLENEELRMQLAKGARKKIEKDFDEKRRSELLFKIYTHKIWKNI